MSTSIYYLIAAYAVVIVGLVGYHMWVRTKAAALDAERRALLRELTREADGVGGRR